ncbi:hypothetical protein BDU57DRAFT_508651 [Ampelomyces quisqualis]|uniref:Uncharacterized protein n=1 Tax=Ampelomyces quisqualis TaxID=50730 RepID=A0A6A5QYK6_AMPQU|nr:hypothetical protein BDU57DRAFT_508651 [Ampelomyces quisqualis]
MLCMMRHNLLQKDERIFQDVSQKPVEARTVAATILRHAHPPAKGVVRLRRPGHIEDATFWTYNKRSACQLQSRTCIYRACIVFFSWVQFDPAILLVLIF